MGSLWCVYYIVLNVKDMEKFCYFYGYILGLKLLVGEEIFFIFKIMVEEGKVSNFIIFDGIVIDLFVILNLFFLVVDFY